MALLSQQYFNLPRLRYLARQGYCHGIPRPLLNSYAGASDERLQAPFFHPVSHSHGIVLGFALRGGAAFDTQ